MSEQAFKSVYFSDYRAERGSRRSLTLAFGVDELKLARKVQRMSSNDIRAALGTDSYAELATAAAEAGTSINTLCVARLREDAGEYGVKLPLPGFGDITWASTLENHSKAPFQRWYPYLEGYSLEFVRAVRERFAAGASRILDPFAGGGSTALATVIDGDRAFYSELNPAMQLVASAKLRAVGLPPSDRAKVVPRLREIADQLPQLLRGLRPDPALAETFKHCFGESEFFDPETFQDVLRMRTFVDTATTSETERSFVVVAAIGALQPSSNLVRAGDLRYRRGREIERRESFIDAVARRLYRIAEDIAEAPEAQGTASLLSSSVHDLNRVPAAHSDALITSPPYLNGTNYFRNTKLELWFIRALRTPGDIRSFRNRAITAGINDVLGQDSEAVHPDVEAIVGRLRETAYDTRIPRMVDGYFGDMRRAFIALRKHLEPDTPVLIDIGDSVYGGVHVPTDRLLAGILEAEGFEAVDSVTLRTRRSRSGLTLGQMLLVFKAPSSRATSATPSQAHWRAGWDIFKRKMPYQEGDFAKRNWGHRLHSLCSFQGKLKPSIAYHLVNTFVPAGGVVLDPFAGVGTIPFEAVLNGRIGMGFEISPAAHSIALAKVRPPQQEDVEGVLQRLHEYLQSNVVDESAKYEAGMIRFNGPLPAFFNEKTFDEILLARSFFAESTELTDAEHFTLACLLHILHGNRPYALSRRSHPITPFLPTGSSKYRALIPRLKAKINRSFDALNNAQPTSTGTVVLQDATDDWPDEFGELDAIVTSPPFFDSTRFYMANWMRLWFAGWQREDFDFEPRRFVDERQKSSFAVYEPIFRQARERLDQDGVVLLHLGRSKKKDMAEEVREVAKPWFPTAEMFEEDVTSGETHGITDKGTVTAHQFLLLR